MYDMGTSDKNIYNVGSAYSKELGEGYVSFSTTNSNSTTGRLTSKTSFTGDIECIIQANITYESQVGVYIGFRDTASTTYRIGVSGWKYLKLKRVNGVYSAQISSDGLNWSDMTAYEYNASNGAVYFYLLIYNNTGNKKTFDFKDLKIYSI